MSKSMSKVSSLMTGAAVGVAFAVSAHAADVKSVDIITMNDTPQLLEVEDGLMAGLTAHGYSEGKNLKVISAGRVKDRFFKKVEAVQRRPERVEIESIGGMDAERVQFIVSGSGKVIVKVDSAKGSVREKEAELK